MISQSWLDKTIEALYAERQEELTRSPVVSGYSLELYKGNKDEITEQLKKAPQFKLKELQDAGYALTHLEYQESAACGQAKQPLLILARPENLKEGANFRARDLIYLFDHKQRLLSRGTIYNMGMQTISLLLDDADPDEITGPFIVTKAGSDATYRYNQQVIKALQNETCKGEQGDYFIKMFFNGEVEVLTNQKLRDPVFAQDLNEQQLKAVQKIQTITNK